MALHQLPLQYNVDAEDDLQSRLATKGLKVLEVFSDWAGPCKSVLPTFKKIRIEKDDESSLAFLTISAEKCQQVEPVKDHQGKSEPLFLFYRNGQLKVKVHGANVPLLLSNIMEHTPANAEIDDLEENPFHLANKKDKSKDAGSALKQNGKDKVKRTV